MANFLKTILGVEYIGGIKQDQQRLLGTVYLYLEYL